MCAERVLSGCVLTSWLELDEQRLVGNFGALRGVLREAAGGDAELLAVIKANAYGHGAAACARMLARGGAEWLGVTDVREGIAVRAALAGAAHARVLVMSGMSGELDEARAVVREALTPVIWAREHVAVLAEARRLEGASEPVRVHLEIDTGMARQGVASGAMLEALLGVIASGEALRLDGVFTHFASTEVAHSAQTAEQMRRFEEAIGQVAAAGLRPDWVHVGNSSFLDNGADRDALGWVRAMAERVGAKPMARAGLGLYGYLLPIEGAGADDVERARALVHSVMCWKTRVIGVREVEAGATVGYNGIFVADRAMRLALLPVGYADGLRRELSGSNARAGGWVLVRGEKAAIVGRVSMNLTVVDVSAIAGVHVGDEAVLLGDGVSADDHARIAGTIAYEILCGVRAQG